MMIDQTYIKAGHAETLPGELCRLAQHPEVAIRRRVAENFNTPLSSLLNLAADPEPDVRVALVFHPVIPFEVLLRLARDECADVRYELAEIVHLPLIILVLLAHDDNPYVAFRARRTLRARRQSFHTTRQGPECGTTGRAVRVLGCEKSKATIAPAKVGMVNANGNYHARPARSTSA